MTNVPRKYGLVRFIAVLLKIIAAAILCVNSRKNGSRPTQRNGNAPIRFRARH